MTASCGIHRWFRTCGQPGAGLCQYCGRTFCERHGDRLADRQEICVRKSCQRKKADLARHVLYKESVAQRNGERLCGSAGCGRAPAGQCSKCRGLFCFAHLEDRQIEERRGSTTVRVHGSLCHHCLKRRRLWAQR